MKTLRLDPMRLKMSRIKGVLNQPAFIVLTFDVGTQTHQEYTLQRKKRLVSILHWAQNIPNDHRRLRVHRVCAQQI